MANSFKIKWVQRPTEKGKKAAEAAFQDVCKEVNEAFQNAIGNDVWDWPNPPSPRDIVDTGRLLRSNTGPKFTKGYGTASQSVSFEWSASYASALYVGFRMGGKTYPGRPWCDAVLGTQSVSGVQQFDFGEQFPKAIQNNLG